MTATSIRPLVSACAPHANPTDVSPTIPSELIKRIEGAVMERFECFGMPAATEWLGCFYQKKVGEVCTSPNESALRTRYYTCCCQSDSCRDAGHSFRMFHPNSQGQYIPPEAGCYSCNSNEYLKVVETNLSTWEKTLGAQLERAFLPNTNGVLITTGSVRALFNALLVPDSCNLIVIRDADLSLISYMHMELLFFKIAKTVAEYNELKEGKKCSTSAELGTDLGKESRVPDDAISGFIKELSRRIEQSELSDSQKRFYHSHLDFFVKNWFAFGGFNQDGWKQEKLVDYVSCWRSTDQPQDTFIKGTKITPECSRWEGVNYWEKEELFYKLKRRIDEGGIILSQGDITDLTDLNELLFFPLERYLMRGSIVFEISNIWEDYKEGIRFKQVGSGNLLPCFSLICTQSDKDFKQNRGSEERSVSFRRYVSPTSYYLRQGIAFGDVATRTCRGADSPLADFELPPGFLIPNRDGVARFFITHMISF